MIIRPYAPVAPQEILDRLELIDPRLGLRLLTLPGGDGKAEWWALTLNWEQNDKRRGDLTDQLFAFDILGYLPLDCSVRDAESYVKNSFLGHKTRPDVNRMLYELDKWNDSIVKDAMKPVEEYGQEMIEANSKTLFQEQGKTVAKVSQYNPPPKKKGRK